MSQKVFECGFKEGNEIASLLSVALNKNVTLEGDDFYLEEPPGPHKHVGYMATQKRFVLWDIRLAILARDFATEIPSH